MLLNDEEELLLSEEELLLLEELLLKDELSKDDSVEELLEANTEQDVRSKDKENK